MKMISSQKARPAKLPSALMRGLPSSTRVMFTPKSGGPQVALQIFGVLVLEAKRLFDANDFHKAQGFLH